MQILNSKCTFNLLWTIVLVNRTVWAPAQFSIARARAIECHHTPWVNAVIDFLGPAERVSGDNDDFFYPQRPPVSNSAPKR